MNTDFKSYMRLYFFIFFIIILLFPDSSRSENFYGDKDNGQKKEEQNKSSIDVDLYHYFEFSTALGMVSLNDLEKMTNSGKLSINPNFIAQAGLRFEKYSNMFFAGYSFGRLSALSSWEEKNYEKGFLLNTSEFHAGIRITSVEKEKEIEALGEKYKDKIVDKSDKEDEELNKYTGYVLTSVNIGYRNINLIPPVYEKYSLNNITEINNEKSRFIKEEAEWGNKEYAVSGIEISVISINRFLPVNKYSRIGLFYIQDNIGLKIDIRGGGKPIYKIKAGTEKDVNIYLFGLFRNIDFFWWGNHFWYINTGIIGIFY